MKARDNNSVYCCHTAVVSTGGEAGDRCIGPDARLRRQLSFGTGATRGTLHHSANARLLSAGQVTGSQRAHGVR